MRQKTLADEGFEQFRKTTRREQFFGEMDQVIPWGGLCQIIKPFYPKPRVLAIQSSGWKGCCVFVFCNRRKAISGTVSFPRR
jgi:hypothetical protein